MYLTNQGSRKFLICGKSGGIGRPNADEVNSLCDPIAEREPSSKLKIAKKSLFSCIYAKNVVILQPNLRWRGMSCGKCFAIGSSLGRFLTY